MWNSKLKTLFVGVVLAGVVVLRDPYGRIFQGYDHGNGVIQTHEDTYRYQDRRSPYLQDSYGHPAYRIYQEQPSRREIERERLRRGY